MSQSRLEKGGRLTSADDEDLSTVTNSRLRCAQRVTSFGVLCSLVLGLLHGFIHGDDATSRNVRSNLNCNSIQHCNAKWTMAPLSTF